MGVCVCVCMCVCVCARAGENAGEALFFVNSKEKSIQSAGYFWSRPSENAPVSAPVIAPENAPENVLKIKYFFYFFWRCGTCAGMATCSFGIFYSFL